MGLLFKNKYGTTDEALWLPLPGGKSWNDTIPPSNIGQDGFYWTSETSASKDSYRLRIHKAIDDESFELKQRGTRGSIRPVYGIIKREGGTPHVDPPTPGEDGTVTVGGYDTETAETAETAYPKEGVNMGLPSGTKWASWNVGAMKYGDLGKYYAYGEITTKDTYTIDNYCASVKGYQVYDLPDSADVAKCLWSKGGNWMMPSEEDFEELFTKDPNNTDSLLYVSVRWEADSIHGNLSGIRVISRENGNSIFFPAGGDKTNGVNGLDSEGWYWTKTGSGLNGKRQSHAKCMNFSSDSSKPNGVFHDLRNNERFYGFMVRPVWSELKSNGSRKIKVKLNDTIQLPFTVLSNDLSKTDVTYSYNNEIVSQLAGKNFKALKKGTTEITIKKDSGKKGTYTLTYQITVTD
jgi:hypothetical protein